jgi:hypothetical protein
VLAALFPSNLHVFYALCRHIQFIPTPPVFSCGQPFLVWPWLHLLTCAVVFRNSLFCNGVIKYVPCAAIVGLGPCSFARTVVLWVFVFVLSQRCAVWCNYTFSAFLCVCECVCVCVLLIRRQRNVVYTCDSTHPSEYCAYFPWYTFVSNTICVSARYTCSVFTASTPSPRRCYRVVCCYWPSGQDGRRGGGGITFT